MATVDLQNLRVYQQAMQIGEAVWALVDGWQSFPKQSLGLQWVRAADSIAANISEGYGRFSFRENARFLYYDRGSLRETQTWLSKAGTRGLVPISEATDLSDSLEKLRHSLDNYIHSLGKSKHIVSEDTFEDMCSAPLPSFDDFIAEHAPV